MKKPFYIYRITNLINQKTYIGKRLSKTIDPSEDDYFGSGILLKKAYQKYGFENFKKEVLISNIYSRDQINLLEKEYIEKERNLGHGEYNIALGGDGGRVFWGLSSEDTPEKRKQQGIDYLNRLASMTEEEKEAYWKEVYKKTKQTKIKNGTWGKATKGTLGYKFTEEQKQRVSEGHKGEKNSSYGKHWWTNGTESIQSEVCPEGFWAGRFGSLSPEQKREKSQQKKQQRKAKQRLYQCVETQEIGYLDFWRQKGINVKNLTRVVDHPWKLNGYHFITFKEKEL